MNTALLHSRDLYPYFQRHTYYASYQELVYENPISWNPRLVTGYCALYSASLRELALSQPTAGLASRLT